MKQKVLLAKGLNWIQRRVGRFGAYVQKSPKLPGEKSGKLFLAKVDWLFSFSCKRNIVAFESSAKLRFITSFELKTTLSSW